MLLCHPRQEIKPITREERLLSKQFDPSNLFHRYLASPNSIYDFWCRITAHARSRQTKVRQGMYPQPKQVWNDQCPPDSPLVGLSPPPPTSYPVRMGKLTQPICLTHGKMRKMGKKAYRILINSRSGGEEPTAFLI
ncbi:hypothetical protein V2G26_016795 [Clonostachys chloroleuca]